ncbi:DUF6000 family protein [Streptomyces inusitatus]|nr:DUF6000 family protein [Streptomyces inusitatus]
MAIGTGEVVAIALQVRQNDRVLMPNDDPEILAAVRRYVLPDRRYMKLRGWNIRHMSEAGQREFGASLAKAASECTDREIIALLKADWRASLIGSWLAGIDLRTNFRDIVGELLFLNESPEKAKGYCFALSRFGEHEDAAVLSAFLRSSPSPGAGGHAKSWALGGLLFIDSRLRTSYAQEFLGEDGLPGSGGDPDEVRLISFLCEFSERYGSLNREPSRCEPDSIASLFRGWRSHALPQNWEIMQQESERVRTDMLLQSFGTGRVGDPFSSVPLSVAVNPVTGEVLFNTSPGKADWVVVRMGSNIGAGIPSFEMFSDIEAVWQFLISGRLDR